MAEEGSVCCRKWIWFLPPSIAHSLLLYIYIYKIFFFCMNVCVCVCLFLLLSFFSVIQRSYIRSGYCVLFLRFIQNRVKPIKSDLLGISIWFDVAYCQRKTFYRIQVKMSKSGRDSDIEGAGRDSGGVNSNRWLLLSIGNVFGSCWWMLSWCRLWC